MSLSGVYNVCAIIKFLKLEDAEVQIRTCFWQIFNIDGKCDSCICV